jgi:hypothetical protein
MAIKSFIFHLKQSVVRMTGHFLIAMSSLLNSTRFSPVVGDLPFCDLNDKNLSIFFGHSHA